MSSRVVCLSLVVVGLVASPGCSSCFGGSSCRRPSFMEFRSPCRRQAEPCMVHEAPACGPACGGACGESYAPAVGSGPCCGQGEVIYSSPMAVPMSAPMSVPGSPSPAESVPAPPASPLGTFS